MPLRAEMLGLDQFDDLCGELESSSREPPALSFTARRYGTKPLYGLDLVRKFGPHEPRTCRSPQRAAHEPAIVSQLRSKASTTAAAASPPSAGRSP
jgi:hypothetical protein